jgi:Transcriptional regulators
MTLNEFLLLESIYELQSKQKTISQNELSIYSGIDTAVVSVVIKNLERKKFIKRITDIDNRKKSIEMLSMGSEQFNIIYPKVITEEQNIFSKLQNEKNNFTNSLRLILGKKLRIKVDNSI